MDRGKGYQGRRRAREARLGVLAVACNTLHLSLVVALYLPSIHMWHALYHACMHASYHHSQERHANHLAKLAWKLHIARVCRPLSEQQSWRMAAIPGGYSQHRPCMLLPLGFRIGKPLMATPNTAARLVPPRGTKRALGGTVSCLQRRVWGGDESGLQAGTGA